ncbi:MAG TPA: xanthine dehydrogenase family protein molybdopterin-binding subunit [Candidatus Acidoferrum sp.]
MSIIGEPLTRVDGRQKVTGAAKFSAEFPMANLAYAVMVQSTIPSGRIASIDRTAAEHAVGVIAVLTPENALKLPGAEKRLSLLQDDLVHYNNQPIAVVVANSLHEAVHGAELLKVRYEDTPAKLDFIAGFPTSHPGEHNREPGDLSFGDVDAGLRDAEIKIDQIYTTPIQHHNPMEPHATIAGWDGEHLTLHDATQHITGRKNDLAKIFGIPAANIHVICLFVGGGFGCKGSTWSHVPLAAMAAKVANRPVKLVLDRPQMFGPIGARPRTHQHLTVGATRDGKLTAIRHEVHAHTSEIEDYLESSAFPTRVMYSCPNVATTHRLVPLNVGTPTYMRAPGVATGTYAVEVAMDELAYQLKMDPLQLRLLNYAEVDPHTKVPFTEKNLRECYKRGAERFGWAKRMAEPRSMSDGSQLIGMGMATETYPGNRLPAGALVRLQPNGRVLVESGTQEIGTGMYTIMTQVTADTLGISPELVDARLGDTNMPEGPISAGSMSTASVTPALQEAAKQAREKLLSLAIQDAQSPVHGAAVEDVEFADGKIFRKGSPGSGEKFTDLLARNGNQPVEATAKVSPDQSLKKKVSSHSFGAVFAEVAVDPAVGMVKVRRVVAVYDVGKVINEKTATSQFIGGIVWGIGLALHEDSYVDPRNGRIANANLAEYHVPVNADIGEIDVSAIDIADPYINPLGARGIGEIGITGTGAAVANAVYHATGKRVRDLPITPDKLIG